MAITILTERELRAVAQLDSDSIATVRDVFSALAGGKVVMPPILRLDIAAHNGEVDVKTAYVPGFDSFAIKISPGFFDNPKLGLPSTNGLMVLFSAETGLVRAVLLDNGYLTDLRTAAAGAVAADCLAPPTVETAGVIGAGAQAALQMRAASLVRDYRRLLVWARDADKAAAFAAEQSAALGLPVEVVRDRETLVRESQLVVTTTPARQPLIEADWLHPGLHITAMGSDAEHKNELAPGVLARADLFVCDRRSQSANLGEWHHAIEAQVLSADAVPVELGEITSGRHPGRPDPAAVTVCDLTGTGAQDTAIARFAFGRATAKGMGSSIDA